MQKELMTDLKKKKKRFSMEDDMEWSGKHLSSYWREKVHKTDQTRYASSIWSQEQKKTTKKRTTVCPEMSIRDILTNHEHWQYCENRYQWKTYLGSSTGYAPWHRLLYANVKLPRVTFERVDVTKVSGVFLFLFLSTSAQPKYHLKNNNNNNTGGKCGKSILTL